MLDPLSLISSVFGGGATGLLGIVVQRWADHKNRKLDLEASRDKMAHEAAMRKADADIMKEEWAQRTKIAEIEKEGKVEQADAEAFAASFREPERYSDGVKPSRGQAWVLIILDTIRALVRPALTVYLCVITTLIYIEARQLLGAAALTSEQAMSLTDKVVSTVLYLTTTCVLWWFGTRNKQQAPKVS